MNDNEINQTLNLCSYHTVSITAIATTRASIKAKTSICGKWLEEHPNDYLYYSSHYSYYSSCSLSSHSSSFSLRECPLEISRTGYGPAKFCRVSRRIARLVLQHKTLNVRMYQCKRVYTESISKTHILQRIF